MKRFLVLILIVLAAAALWVGGWFYVAGEIENEAQRLAEADGIVTPRVECGNFTVSGFPFHFSPICTEATITSGDLTLTIPEVRATALFYRPTHLQIFAASPARLSDAFTGSVHEVSWENLRASLRLDGGRIARFSMLGDNLAHTDALFGTTEFASAGHLEFHLIDATPADAPDMGGATLDVFMRLDNVASAGFDITNGAGTLDARITGLPPLDLLAHPEALRLWQMADGTVTLRALDAHADGLDLTAEGEAALSEAGLLNATLALSSRGLVERAPGLDQDPVATMFIGQPDADGTYSQNLSVREGRVFVGILPMTMIDPLF